MKTFPLSAVVDASVGVKLFVIEEHSDRAVQLFENLSYDPPAIFYVPDLFYSEFANILWKYTRRFGRPLEDSLADLANLRTLALRVAPNAGLMEEALEMAVQTGLTAYDACYAVLARRLSIPLITADQLHSRTIPWAVWIGDLEQRS